MFLGSNIDAVQNGTSIGITQQTYMNYNSSENGYYAVFRSASQVVVRFRSSEPTEDRKEVLKRVAFTETDHETIMYGCAYVWLRFRCLTTHICRTTHICHVWALHILLNNKSNELI